MIVIMAIVYGMKDYALPFLLRSVVNMV